MISSNKLSKEIICNKLKAVPSPSCPLSFFLKHRSMLLLSTVFSSQKRSQTQEFLFPSLAREDFKKFILAWKLLLKVQPRKRDSNKNIKGLTLWGEISPQLYSYDCNGRNLHMNILHLSTYFWIFSPRLWSTAELSTEMIKYFFDIILWTWRKKEGSETCFLTHFFRRRTHGRPNSGEGKMKFPFAYHMSKAITHCSVRDKKLHFNHSKSHETVASWDGDEIFCSTRPQRLMVLAQIRSLIH